jgi:hypothetical protein
MSGKREGFCFEEQTEDLCMQLQMQQQMMTTIMMMMGGRNMFSQPTMNSTTIPHLQRNNVNDQENVAEQEDNTQEGKEEDYLKCS